MLVKNEKITVFPKPGLTYFQNVNKKTLNSIFGGINIRVSKYLSAINNMTARHTLNTMLLRQILGVNPDSHNINWDELVRMWWSNISINISEIGYNMEVGLTYDINDPQRKQYISKLPNCDTDEKLIAYVEKHIPIEERFKYGTPIETLQYLQYLYLLIHREVANDIKDIDKSTNIKMYIHTDESAKRNEAEIASLHLEVSALITEISKDPNKVRQALIAHNLLDGVKTITILPDKNSNIIALTTLAMNQPKLFKLLLKDSKLAEKAFIGELLNNNIVTRLMGSDTIVLGTDINIILGSSVDDVINYFIDPKNSEMKSSITKQLNAIKASSIKVVTNPE